MKTVSTLYACITALTLSCCRGFDAGDQKPVAENIIVSSKGEATPGAASEGLAQEVREIIRPTCGSCHTSTLPTAKSGAIRIFDLVRDDWVEMMSAENLESFRRRLEKLDEPNRTKVRDLVNTRLIELGHEAQ